VLGRSRPELLFNDGLYGFYGLKLSSKFWSFPSGHTSTIMGFVFGLCIVFPRDMYAFILTGFTIATSRILLTHHFLSDVLMATYLSFLEISLFYYWVKRKKWMTEAISITHHP
jgi:membrane-associated phospholipid phosphatase